MNLIKRIFRKSKPSFIKIETNFIAQDGLFTATFEPNWQYTHDGNSFYSFSNITDDLKGFLQVSIVWNEPVCENTESLDSIELDINNNETSNTNRVTISDEQCIHYFNKPQGSNMDQYYWVLFPNKILIQITFAIYEKEDEAIKEKWLNTANKILSTFIFNQERILKTTMR